MKVLVVGSGGREHAITWKLANSPSVQKIYAAPGNAGIYRQAELVNIKAEDIESLARFAKEKEIDLTVVGPEVPLALGIVDRFQELGLKIFGPSRAAARIESSKVWAKQFMRKHHIPSASFMIFDNMKEAIKFVRSSALPIAIKADGLAAGKGVTIANTIEEAESAVREAMQKRRFGEAGARIVIEDVLVGEEASILALTDGTHVLPLIPSQDHKRIGEGDTGPNTGGMGAYAPVPFVSAQRLKDIRDLILEPAVAGLRAEGCPFRGVLYAGLMITDRGPRVIEFNCRFGDPETQAVLPLLKSDLGELFMAVVDQDLEFQTVEWEEAFAVCVILASAGYPGSYEKGKVIYGLNDLKEKRNVEIFHSGTYFENRKFLTAGGRVLGVTAIESTVEEAVAQVYEAIERVRFEGMQFRSDIALKAVNRKFQVMG
jgi:phosphoribosylamine--glycine ligase